MRIAFRIIGAIAVTVAALYAIDVWTIAPILCARTDHRAARALDHADRRDDVSQRVAARDVERSLAECDANSYEHFFVLGGTADMLDDPRAAAASYRRALDFDRRPEAYFALGMSEIAALDQRAAIVDLTRAVAFDPSRLEDIPYETVRAEVKRRVEAYYGKDWFR